MTSPTPFPTRTTEAAVLASVTLDPGGATITGDAILADSWGGSGTLSLHCDQLGFWGNNPGTEQDPAARSTRATFTLSGLPANTYVRVSVAVAFYSQAFGAAGKFVGMEVAGAQFTPGVAPSESGTPNVGTVTGYGTTSGSGTLVVAFGASDITVSCTLNIIFSDMVVSLPSAEFADILIDSAVAWQLGNPTSVTRGSLSFDANEEWENYAFAGKTMPVAGLDECVRSRPVVKGTMMMTGEDQFLMYRPGGAWGDSATAGGVAADGIRTYTPGTFRGALGTGVYLVSFIVIWKRLRGDYLAVEFPLALCTKYSIGSQDGDEGLIPVEFEARQDVTSEGPKTAIPYLIHILPSTFAFGAA